MNLLKVIKRSTLPYHPLPTLEVIMRSAAYYNSKSQIVMIGGGKTINESEFLIKQMRIH